MTILTLLFAVSSLARPHDLTNDCTDQMRKLAMGFAITEAAASNGQIEACVPAADAKHNVAALQKSENDVATRFDNAYGKWLEGSDSTDTIRVDVAQNGGGNICGASNVVIGDVNDMLKRAINAAADLEQVYKDFGADEYAFSMNYLNRKSAFAKAAKQSPKTCANAKSNVDKISKEYQKVDDTCRAQVEHAGTTVKYVQQLRESLRGCASK